MTVAQAHARYIELVLLLADPALPLAAITEACIELNNQPLFVRRAGIERTFGTLLKRMDFEDLYARVQLNSPRLLKMMAAK